MQRIGLFFGVAFAVSITSAAQAPAEERLRVNVFPGPQHLALYVAQDKGLFAKRGLTVERTRASTWRGSEIFYRCGPK